MTYIIRHFGCIEQVEVTRFGLPAATLTARWLVRNIELMFVVYVHSGVWRPLLALHLQLQLLRVVLIVLPVGAEGAVPPGVRRRVVAEEVEMVEVVEPGSCREQNAKTSFKRT